VGLEKSDDSAWDAGSAAGDDAPLTCPLVRPCRRGVDAPPRRADHIINALITTNNNNIIIIHLFAINKQSLTQSKEWQVTRET